MEIATTKFQGLWNDFVSSFKGSLIMESRKQNVNYPLAKMLLNNCLLTWTSEYTVNGRWLYNLMRDEPEKGKLVKDIIKNDITLSPVNLTVSKSDCSRYIIPLGAGALGFGASYFAGLATPYVAGATIIPMAIAYPLTTRYLANKKEKAIDAIINAYVSQLEKYKQSIISALLAQ